MAVDYDLIILGATPAGIQAAIAAATLKARVALVTQEISPRHLPEAVPQQALLHLAQRITEQTSTLRETVWQACPPSPWQWHQVQPWIDAVVGNVAAERSEVALAYHGVDVIPGRGEFCRKPALGVRIGDRYLTARGYLLTMDARPLIPAIAGLDSAGYLTPEQIPAQLATLASCSTVAILGGGNTAIELAQILIGLEVQPILVTPQTTLLPHSDREVAQMIQAQLEAAGAQIWLHTQLDQVRSQPGKKQVLMGDQVLTVDEIIVAAGHSPNLETLNLDAVEVQWDAQGIPVKSTLQTSNPRIYACEGRVGWDCVMSVAQYEAAIALKNILYFPWHRVNAQRIPFALHTAPSAAWIGLTAEQASQQYGSRQVYGLRRSLHTLPQAQIRDDLTGFCKLVVHRNGRLLGAHLVGTHASEAIAVLALAMQQRLKVTAIARLRFPSSTFADLIQQTAADFRRLSLKHHPWQQDLIDSCFDVRRAWSRNTHK